MQLGKPVHITSDETLCWNTIYRIIAGALGVEYGLSISRPQCLRGGIPRLKAVCWEIKRTRRVRQYKTKASCAGLCGNGAVRSRL